jgi:microcystin-dependent protein
MSYTIYAISVIVILILGLIVKEDTLSQSVKIILCTIVGLVAYCALNLSTTEGFAQRKGKRRKKNKENIGNIVDTKIEKLEFETRLSELVPKGTIVMYHKAEAPKGWALCDGRDAVDYNTKTTMKTPDLRGRFILGAGESETNKLLTNRKLDDRGGVEKLGLEVKNLPAHRHPIGITQKGGYGWGGKYAMDLDGSTETGIAGNSNEAEILDKDGVPTIPSVKKTIGDPFEIMPPYYVLTYIIKAS